MNKFLEKIFNMEDEDILTLSSGVSVAVGLIFGFFWLAIYFNNQAWFGFELFMGFVGMTVVAAAVTGLILFCIYSISSVLYKYFKTGV